MNTTLNQLASFLAGALIVFLAMTLRNCGSKAIRDSLPGKVRIVKDTDTVTVTKTQTRYVQIVHTDTVTVDSIKLVPVYVQRDTVDPTKPPIALYSDSVSLDSGRATVGYKARVEGRLLGLTLGLHYKTKETITEKNTETTIREFPAGIYLGGSVGLNKIAPRISIANRKHQVSFAYDLISKQPEVGYSIRLNK